MSFVFDRFHTIDVSGLARDIEASGKTERQYVAQFSVAGRLLSLDEVGSSYNEEIQLKLGKNAGVQFVPFNVKVIPETGAYYVAFNAVSFKNMNSYIDNSYWDEKAGFFKVVDKMDIGVFKFERGVSFANMESFNWRVVDVDLKLDILGSKRATQYLAVTAGGDIGGGMGSVTTSNGNRIYFSQANDKGEGSVNGSTAFTYSYRGGLEFGDDIGKVRVTARAGVAGQTYGNLAAYNTETNTTGRVTFNSLYAVPGLEISTKVSGKVKRPVRVGLGIGANLAINHTLQSEAAGLNINMGNLNNNKYNARLIITF